MTTVILDADILLYKCAGAGEERKIEVEHTKTGRAREFDNITAFKKWLADPDQCHKDGSPRWTLDDFIITDIQIPPPVEHSLHNVKTLMERIKEVTKPKKMEIYLGKGDGFRKYLDLPKNLENAEKSGYKGGRKDALKPVNLPDVRQYLLDKYNAVEIEDIEADDMVSIRTYEGYQVWKKTGKDRDKVIAVTTDKDARQTEGWLFNFDKMDEPMLIDGLGKLYIESKTTDSGRKSEKVMGHGRLWLYFQWIAGDPVDSYKPSKLANVKFGDKGAFKLLQDVHSDRQAFERVGRLYKEWYPEPITYTTWDDREVTKCWWEIAQMYWDCAFMKRWKEDEVDVRHLFKNAGLIKAENYNDLEKA